MRLRQPPGDLPLPAAALNVWTWAWERRRARRLVLLAKRNHLTVIHEHDGGWLLRYHLISVSGDSERVLAYGRVVARLRRGASSPRP